MITEAKKKKVYDLLKNGLINNAYLAYSLYKPEGIGDEGCRTKFKYKLDRETFTPLELELIEKIINETLTKTGKVHKNTAQKIIKQ